MRCRPVAELLALPVRLHGIELGRLVEMLLDERADRVVGFEILCGDGAHRFLPFAVAVPRDDELEVTSALALLDERDLDFYRRHGRRLSQLGFADPCVDEDGVVREVLTAA